VLAEQSILQSSSFELEQSTAELDTLFCVIDVLLWAVRQRSGCSGIEARASGFGLMARRQSFEISGLVSG